LVGSKALVCKQAYQGVWTARDGDVITEPIGAAQRSIPATMAALCKRAPGLGMTLERVGVPALGPSDVLVRVRKAGICGTDQHIFTWDAWAQRRIRPPLIVGHEFMGLVAATGSAVRGFEVGDRVSAEGHISCGLCLLCRTGEAHICEHVRIIGVDSDGAFAEYIRMPAVNVWKLDPAIPDEIAAIFDPLGNAVHTVMAAGVSTKSVVITGVGSIGLMAIPVARAAGAASVFAIDVNPSKLALAERVGADAVFHANDPNLIDEILRRTSGDGADVLLEMSGSASAIDAGLHMLRNGGRAALLGIPPDDVKINLAERIIFKGLTVLGINGRKMFETWYQTEALVKSGRVDLRPIITHVVPFTAFEDAFELMRSGVAAKIVLDVEGTA
jgi:threonine 3-dehydrogenase